VPRLYICGAFFGEESGNYNKTLTIITKNNNYFMKKIEAIIRKSRFQEVRRELHEADIDFLSWWDVKGQGTARQGLIFRGVAYDVNAIDRLYITFVVREVNLQKSINAILKAAYTGESGDGRIFVSDIEQSIRIRTGDKGDESLYDKE
jgi:nitrogen regulatory protein P-II 1